VRDAALRAQRVQPAAIWARAHAEALAQRPTGVPAAGPGSYAPQVVFKTKPHPAFYQPPPASIFVSAPFPSLLGPVVTENHLCRACSCQEILRMATARQAVRGEIREQFGLAARWGPWSAGLYRRQQDELEESGFVRAAMKWRSATGTALAERKQQVMRTFGPPDGPSTGDLLMEGPQ
jgi:hypothetical protein